MPSWILYIAVIIASPIILPLLLGFIAGCWQGLREPVREPSATREEEQWQIIRDITGEGRLRVFRAEDDDE
jgi:hypothetical protein